MASRRQRRRNNLATPTSSGPPVVRFEDGMLVVPSTKAGTRVRLPTEVLVWLDTNPDATKREITDQFACSRAAAKTLRALWSASTKTGHRTAVTLPDNPDGCKTAQPPKPAARAPRTREPRDEIVLTSFEDLKQLSTL